MQVVTGSAHPCCQAKQLALCPMVMQDVGAAYFGVPGATGFMVSFDPQTGERTEKLIMRGDKPFEGWPF